jgi:hypothetical protein
MTVLRVAKLKSWGSIGGAGTHNARQRETPNADPSLTPSNLYFIGEATDHLPSIVREKIGEQTIRKNAVLAFEVVMSASPQYFRPNAPEQGGQWDQERLNQWAIASMDWLYRKWGDRIISAVLHLDEQTPHIQALIVPLDDQGKLNCRALLGGSRQTLRDLQTSYARGVQHLGIQRGIEGSKAKHRDIQSYYRHANSAFEPLPEVTAQPPAALRPAPEAPGIFASRATRAAYQTDTERWEREKRTRDEQAQKLSAERQAQIEAALASARCHQAQAAQAALLAEEIAALKTENSRLLAERQALKAEADRLRGTDLAEVLQRLYGAQEAADSRPGYRTRKFEIEGCPSTIAITGELWMDNATGKGGKGAINLVMHLEGYGQDGYQKAVRLLADQFGAEQAGKDIGRRSALESGTAIQTIQQQQPIPLPTPQPATWPRARAYLVNKRRIPAELVDQLHEQGLIYSDERANLVFKQDDDTGCFKRGSYDPENGPPFKQTLGRGGKPFVLAGQRALYVTEGPIDALALKALYPESTVIATGGNCPLERLQPYFQNVTECIYLAHDNDAAGNRQAERFAAEYFEAKRQNLGKWHPPTERHAPETAKDWSAVLMAAPHLARWRAKTTPRLPLAGFSPNTVAAAPAGFSTAKDEPESRRPNLVPEPPKPRSVQSILDELRAETARRRERATQPEPSQTHQVPDAPAPTVQPAEPRPVAPVFQPPKGPGMAP